MKDLFANLYNKVFSFFHQAEEKSSESAKDVACNRLKLVLMQDRTNLSPAIMERMRGELIDLLSKYLELDRELLDLNFEQEDEQMALMLSIPVIRAKDEQEIEEILRKEDNEIENSDCEPEDEENEEDEAKTEDEVEDEDKSDETSQEDDEIEKDNQEDKSTVEKESKKSESLDSEENVKV